MVVTSGISTMTVSVAMSAILFMYLVTLIPGSSILVQQASTFKARAGGHKINRLSPATTQRKRAFSTATSPSSIVRR